MRKIYETYFHIPKQDKGVVGEKVFLTRLILSIICILVCTLAIGYNAYAYFAVNIELSANVLQAATFDVEVDVKSTLSDTTNVVKLDEAAQAYSLVAGTYQLTLKVKPNSTVSTGYCKIEAKSANQPETVFYTQQFCSVLGQDVPVLERTILISVDEDTEIRVTPCWGTYAGAETKPETYLADNYMISVKGQQITKDAVPNSVAPAENTPSTNEGETIISE